MMFKIKKEDLLARIEINAKQAAEYALVANASTYYGQQVSVNLNELISRSIAAAVSSAIETLIDNQYSNEDFERDMTLTD